MTMLCLWPDCKCPREGDLCVRHEEIARANNVYDMLPCDVEPSATKVPTVEVAGNTVFISELAPGQSVEVPLPEFLLKPDAPTPPPRRSWWRIARVCGYHLAAGAIGATCAMFAWNAVTAQGGATVVNKDAKSDMIVPIPVKTIHYRVVTDESKPVEAEAKVEPKPAEAKKPAPKKKVRRRTN